MKKRTIAGLRTEIKKRRERTVELLELAHQAYFRAIEHRAEGARLDSLAKQTAYETQELITELDELNH